MLIKFKTTPGTTLHVVTLVDGEPVGGNITTGFTEPFPGRYRWSSDGIIADDWEGEIRICDAGDAIIVRAPFTAVSLTEQGVQGPQGPQGIQGTDGVDGAQGPQGVAGNNGSPGAPGEQGIQGPAGANGSNGSQGIQGIQGTQGLQGNQGIQGPPGDTGAPGPSSYAINVQALTNTPVDAQTVFFGMLPKAPVTAAGTSRIFIRRVGTIKIAEIYCFAGTAGSAENWSVFVRKNNTTDTLIATVAAATSQRVFSNAAIDIPVVAGDYIEIKVVNPTFATNPATAIWSGYLLIEA